MNAITGAWLREAFLEFFASRGHAVIPSASLVTENDPTVLFTTAGMQPLVPYLLGQPHPQGSRLANVQKCLRTGDLDEVGDTTHLTFFEMLGNWSLGDYFKEEAITWSHEFLTSDRYLGIPTEKLAVTVFAGDEDAPRDEESATIWVRLGVPKERVFFFGKQENWWGPAGQTGPCGPDTEMFYDTGKPACGRPTCGPNCPCEKWVEIWNDVFMEYEKRADGSVGPLQQKNVDTGMGLERTVAVLSGADSVYASDLLQPILAATREVAPAADLTDQRRLADHLRAATFVLTDPRGVLPSNVEQGYVLRRLIRRALRVLEVQHVPPGQVSALLERIPAVVAMVSAVVYPEVAERRDHAVAELKKEQERFAGVMERAKKLLGRLAGSGKTTITGAEGFAIYQETGAHPDLLASLAPSFGLTVDTHGFAGELQKHQDVSRGGITQRFAGGLADHSAETTKLHTAHHLLLKALQHVLGPQVKQRGSNITAERLRMDFSHSAKLTDAQKSDVEHIVNTAIAADYPVIRSEMSREEAETLGAEHEFGTKYPERVSVYSVGPKDATPENPRFAAAFSIEFCGGPHVERTGEIGKFRITKEEAVSAGIRRIRAVVEE